MSNTDVTTGHLIDIPKLYEFAVGEIAPIKSAVSLNALAIQALSTEVDDLANVYADSNGIVRFGTPPTEVNNG